MMNDFPNSRASYYLANSQTPVSSCEKGTEAVPKVTNTYVMAEEQKLRRVKS